MKNILLLLLLALQVVVLKAQNTESLIEVHTATSVEMNALTPNQGALIYNTTENSLYVYNGTIWEKHKNLGVTTSETINIGSGNQTINVSNASNIVGFSLLSNFNGLSSTSGKITDTWIINDDRDKIRCLMQVFEPPNINYIAVTVQIKNANNTIVISNYTSRYWNISNATPQASLSNHSTIFQLDKIIILRKE